MERLQGRNAVVTGAGSGLGAALARLFAEAGANVALLDIDADAANANATTIATDLGVTTTSTRVDVGDAASVVAGAEHVRATLGGCDILCSNVGVQQFGAIVGRHGALAFVQTKNPAAKRTGRCLALLALAAFSRHRSSVPLRPQAEIKSAQGSKVPCRAWLVK